MSGYLDFGDVEKNTMDTFARRVGGRTKAKPMMAKVRTRMKRMGNYVLKDVKATTPVDTGTLRRAWTLGKVEYTSSYVSISVDNNTEYASFIEKGHRTKGGNGWVRGQHMLRDATKEAENRLDDIFEPVIQQYLEDLFND